MSEVPDYQAWANVINSVPTYSTMGTSPAVVSSPLINLRPLVETMEDQEENTVGGLAAAAELVNETLTASSATTNLPTSPSITTTHALSQHHHQRPSRRACQQALSANNELPKAHARVSQHPRVFKPRSSEWKPKRAAKRERFQKRMRHYRDTHRTTHIGQPRTKRDRFLKCMRHFRDTQRTSPRVFCTPWRPSAPTSRRISHSEPSQNPFCGHLGLTYVLPIILGVSILQPFCWLLTIVSRGQPSLMFLQHQAVARWVAWDQTSLSQAFLALPTEPHGSSLPASLGVCFVPSTSSLPVMTPWILPSPNTIEPLLALPPFRPPLLSPSLHAASIKLRLLPAASLLPMVEPPVAVSIPATLSAFAPLHRPTVILLASRRPLFPSQGVHFCFSSLISPLSSVGCYVQTVPWGGGFLLFLLLLFTCSAQCPNLSSGVWSSSQQRFCRHPITPLHRRYPQLHPVSRNDKRWLGRRHQIQAGSPTPHPGLSQLCQRPPPPQHHHQHGRPHHH